MLDQWFRQEVDQHFANYDRLVLKDPSGDYEFLVDELEKDSSFQAYRIEESFDDLSVKYQIEKNHDGEPCLIYSRLPEDELRFCREYAETNPTPGNLKRKLHSFIQNKLDFTATDFRPSDYVMFGKESIGKGEEFWDRIKAEGVEAVLGNFERNMVEFLSHPQDKHDEFNDEVWDVFCDKLADVSGLSTQNKPADTLADEFVEYMFDQFFESTVPDQILDIYKEWIRDHQCNDELLRRASNYNLPADADEWDVNPEHPFEELDRRMATQVIEHLGDEDWLAGRKGYIRQRRNAQVLELLDTDYWSHLLALVSPTFSKEAHEIQSLDQFINEVYPNDIARLDQAVRHLYTAFSNDSTLKQRIENYYSGLLEPYWNVWFDSFEDDYQPNQQGLIKRIFQEANSPCAVIVCDAVALEVAQEVTDELASSSYDYELTPKRGDFPSTTEHNKSLMYSDSGTITLSPDERENLLSDELEIDLETKNLAEFNRNDDPVDHLILYQNDADDLMEKLSQRGLKYLPDAQEEITRKVQSLLNSDYREVHVVSDHGFVLYGSVENADKIPVNDLPEDYEKKDRFVATKDPLSSDPNNSLHLEKDYKDYKHLYFARGLKPFRSPNEYGFAHGGITPQELLIPHLSVRLKDDAVGQDLEVKIDNKDALSDVPVNNPDIKLKAGRSDDLMDASRKVKLLFIRDGDVVMETNSWTITAGDETKIEQKFDEMDDCQVELIDSDSRKTLDETGIHFEAARDMGGLM